MLRAVSRLPPIRDLHHDLVGEAYFLCAGKQRRVSRAGEPWVHVLLEDATGQIAGKLFPPEAERYGDQFEAGEFVLAEGRVGRHSGQLEILLTGIRSIDPVQERDRGFREEDCVLSAPRSVTEMWRELTDRVGAVRDQPLGVLLHRILADHGERLRTWPAALTVHHAYRGGLLEHMLQVGRAGEALARLYDADADLVFAGALLHDIGKLHELEYDRVPAYSREGNLVGHVGLGLLMLREAAREIAGLSAERRGEIEHLIASHHGSRELGALVEPRTIEALILAAADDLDAKLHQVRRHIAADDSDGEFTSFHPRLKRVFLKPPGQG
jgi:3'-5' exoribonuclease